MFRQSISICSNSIITIKIKVVYIYACTDTYMTSSLLANDRQYILDMQYAVDIPLNSILLIYDTGGDITPS
jgi:hypothetical protein